MTVKAIETVYNGYRFRSRLEARWAVFFDTLGVPYTYEKEGYDLDGTWYLPDFWLPEHKCWIEIKGEKPTDEEQMKLIKLSDRTGKRAFIFYDEVWLPKQKEIGGALGPDPNFYWAQCPFCGKFDIVLEGNIRNTTQCRCPHELFSQSDHEEIDRELGHILYPYVTNERALSDTIIWTLDFTMRWVEKLEKLLKFLSYDSTPQLITAYTAARQARFEHGEKGIV